MEQSNSFFKAININSKLLSTYSKSTNIPLSRLKYYNEHNIFPSGKDLKIILKTSKLSKIELMLKMGFIDKVLLTEIKNNASAITQLLNNTDNTILKNKSCDVKFHTELGKLYQEDCIDFLNSVESDSIDLVFADPPFNLKKLYPSNIDDDLKADQYIEWCQTWLKEVVRVLKPGGSLFLWNLPKWNTELTGYLNSLLTFKHWIATDIKYGLPIKGRLYPSHYSLLYYTKGLKANVFHPDRLPMRTCPKCFGDLVDYGGYKSKMNPNGITLTDVWYDIPPVRHAKYKRRKGSNELSIKLLDRIIEMSTNEGQTILDPFGGSGTTYIVAELKNRKWLGCEIGPLDIIIDRFKKIKEEKKILKSYRQNYNTLFPEKTYEKRKNLGLWTYETYKR